MEALRFPWEEADRRREVAPSVFRPRKTRSRTAGRSHATRPPSRRSAERSTRIGLPRQPVVGPAPSPALARAAGHARRETPTDRNAGRVLRGPQRELHEPDYLLMAAAVALTSLGILMVYSSTGHASARETGSVFDVVAEQIGWALLGGLVLLVVMRLDYRYWRSFSILGMVVTLVLLVLVLGPEIPPLLDPIQTDTGATRWLRIGGLPSFQPSELAKLALVVFFAHWLTTRGGDIGSFRRGLVPFTLIVGSVAALVALEPDLGTTGVLVLAAFTMFFVAGGSIWQLLALLPVGFAAVAAFVATKPYMLERVEIFLDPFKDPLGAGHQTVQGLNAMAFGGLTGQGLGVSQSSVYVPAAANDFIFAVVGHEFGYLGGLVVIALFMLLAWRGMRVAMHAPDTFGGLLALGITAWLGFQAFINIGVVVNLIPMTGMPLPFLSKGGTSLVVVLAAVGILLSISRETVTRGADAHEDPHRGRGHGRPYLPRVGRRDPAADPAA